MSICQCSAQNFVKKLCANLLVASWAPILRGWVRSNAMLKLDWKLEWLKLRHTEGGVWILDIEKIFSLCRNVSSRWIFEISNLQEKIFSFQIKGNNPFNLWTSELCWMNIRLFSSKLQRINIRPRGFYRLIGVK